ncbi:MAG TPA: ribosome-associated translation inhibitor RaiA [bacterium]|nr:ribosome-associated translation inhibitor RaiA [bacterium]
MQVHIHAKNIGIRDNLREYAEEKLGKLQKVYPEILSADVHFSRRAKNSGEDKYKLEIMLHCAGALVRAEDDSTSPFAAIDFVAEKLERQLKRFKGKVYRNLSRDAKRRTKEHTRVGELLEEETPDLEATAGTPYLNGAANGVAEEVFEPLGVDEDGDDESPRIVRSKSFAMKPMSPGEAAMQMELLGHDFHVFFNPESSAVNVVYKRRDGNYGLIEPNVPAG